MKKLGRRGIADVAAANQFVATEYWADHNARFARPPASPEDFHVRAPGRGALDRVFQLEETRTVSNDWVVRYDNRFFQLERQSPLAPARSKVVIREDVTGQIEIRYRDRAMRWTEVGAPVAAPAPVVATSVQRPTAPKRPRRHVPCADHPWRRVVDQFRIDQQLEADRKAYDAVNP